MLYITGYWLIRGGSEPLNRLLSSGITTSDVSDAMAEVTFKRHLQSILRLHMNGIIEVQLLLSILRLHMNGIIEVQLLLSNI